MIASYNASISMLLFPHTTNSGTHGALIDISRSRVPHLPSRLIYINRRRLPLVNLILIPTSSSHRSLTTLLLLLLF